MSDPRSRSLRSYSPFLTCRQAARLITARLDRDLNPFERLGLHLHLRICDACPTVIRQLAQLRRSVRDLRNGSEE